MRKIPILLILLTLTRVLGATDVHGPVGGVWTQAGSPYYVVGDIAVPHGSSLVIEEGVLVHFWGYYKFAINGRLQAVGSATDSIIFTGDTFAGWGGLRFNSIDSQPDSSRLVYCRFSHGKSSGLQNAGDDKHGGAIFCDHSSKLRIEHCLFNNNRTSEVIGGNGQTGDPGTPGGTAQSGHGGAIYLRYSSPLLAYNTFWSNQTGLAIGGTGGFGYDVYTGEGNPAYGGDGGNGGTGFSGNGGAIAVINGNPIVLGNVFSANHTGNATGGWGGEGGVGSSIGSWTTPGYGAGGWGGDGGTGVTGSGGAIYLENFIGVISVNQFLNNFVGFGAGGHGGYGGNGHAHGNGAMAIGGHGGMGGGGTGGRGGAISGEPSNLYMTNNLLVQCVSGVGEGDAGGDGGSADVSGPNSISWGGGGGNGGNGSGGNGGALNTGNSWVFLTQQTLNQNNCGVGIPGNGGAGGAAQTAPGNPGVPGTFTHGLYAVFAPNSGLLQISNSIFWRNLCAEIPTGAQISYSCLSELYPGVGNIAVDPCFVSTYYGSHFLSQFAAGQQIQSPCVDAGCPDPTLPSGTTRTDLVPDANVVDMGYHYQNDFNPSPLLVVSPPYLFFTTFLGGGNPPNQVFSIINSQGGSFNFEITEGIPWLSVNPLAGGPVPPTATIAVTVDITGLTPGYYFGNIEIIAPGVPGSPDTVAVTLFINGPVLSISPMELDFHTGVYGTNLLQENFSIANVGLGQLWYNVTETIPWLTVSPLSGGPVPPTAVESVFVDITGLAVGLYEDSILITAPGSIFSPLSMSVTLTIDSALFGTIAGWLPANTYRVSSNLSVLSGDSLTIAAGTRLLFQGAFAFNIFGKLTALGTATDSIYFLPDTGTVAWKGLHFINSLPDSSLLAYCRISGSDSSGIIVDSAKLSLQHCLITDNSAIKGGGIRSEDSQLGVLHCSITGNQVSGSPAKGGGVFLLNTTAWFDSCQISYNSISSDTGYGGGMSLHNSDPLIRDCQIQSNSISGFMGRGGGVYYFSSYPQFEHCLITDNAVVSLIALGGGVYGVNDSCLISNCTIYGNSVPFSPAGGGIHILNSVLSLLNCIVAGNQGGGLAYALPYPSSICYNDFFDNAGGDFCGFAPGILGVLLQTNHNGDSCDVYQNIFLDPLLVAPQEGDYHLTEASPCIDAGDPDYYWDPDSTIADQGAYYFDQSMGISTEEPRNIPQNFSLTPPYPNPFNPNTLFTYGLPTNSPVNLTIFDLQGREIAVLVKGNREAGIHQLTWRAEGVASGIYIYRLQAGDYVATGKMVLLK